MRKKNISIYNLKRIEQLGNFFKLNFLFKIPKYFKLFITNFFKNRKNFRAFLLAKNKFKIKITIWLIYFVFH